MQKETPFQKAVRQAGGYTATAKTLGFNHRSDVHRWNGRGIPAKHCKALCEIPGVTVKEYELRPDIFPKPRGKK